MFCGLQFVLMAGISESIEAESALGVSEGSIEKWFEEGYQMSRRGKNIYDLGRKFTGKLGTYGQFIIWTPRAIAMTAGFDSREESWENVKRERVLTFLKSGRVREPRAVYISTMVFFPSPRKFHSIRIALEQGKTLLPTPDLPYLGVFESPFEVENVVSFIPPVYEDSYLGWKLEDQNALYTGTYSRVHLLKLSRGLDSVGLYNWVLLSGGCIPIRSTAGELQIDVKKEIAVLLSINGVSVSGKIRLPR